MISSLGSELTKLFSCSQHRSACTNVFTDLTFESKELPVFHIRNHTHSRHC
uniref:Uncharacterized protein n=1 Tax=Anguilla anguilla TaxID=7936 RepID=A0A0E9PW51_ANGAN